MKFLFLIAALMLLLAPVNAQDAPVLPAALESQLDDLVTVTENLRGLDTITPVERAFPTREETIEYLNDVYSREYPPEEWARQEAMYIALGLLPSDADLETIYLDLLGSQVAGFYDTDTEVMNVLPSGGAIGDSLSFTEQIIFTHEYTHALQDQHYDLDALFAEATAADDPAFASPDRALAVVSLTEGDATAIMYVYTEEVASRNPFAALLMLSDGLQAGNLFLPPGIPPALTRELIFPYSAGLNFVVALYEDGGWDAIDAAYENPPTTTEHILHPETYLAGETSRPVLATDMGVPADGTLLWDTSIGEFMITQHLRSQLDAETASAAAAGWDGDRFQLVQMDDGRLYWSLAIMWDTMENAEEFLAAYRQLMEMRSGTPAEMNSSIVSLMNGVIYIDGVVFDFTPVPSP